jgi:hypothetical protein
MVERSGELTAVQELAKGLEILGKYTEVLGIDAEVIFVGDFEIHEKLTLDEKYQLKQLGWCSGREDKGQYEGYFVFV